MRHARPGSGVRMSFHHGAIILRRGDKSASRVFQFGRRPFACWNEVSKRSRPKSLIRTRRCSFTARCRAADYCLPPDAVSKRSPRAGGRSTIGDPPESTKFSQSKGTQSGILSLRQWSEAAVPTMGEPSLAKPGRGYPLLRGCVELRRLHNARTERCRNAEPIRHQNAGAGDRRQPHFHVALGGQILDGHALGK